jgi:alpha-beta hydrolase superfamily lysophospholipase
MDTDILPGCEHLWYDSCVGGAKLHYRKFMPKEGKPKAILVYVHGIQTHGGKAFVLADGRKLNLSLLADVCDKENFSLYAPDMYGHGFSEGTRWMIPTTWENNLKDLTNFVDLIQGDDPKVPLFLLGESYGGTLTIHAAKQYQDHPESAPKNFRGIMLTGPAIVGDVPPYPVYFVLRYVLAPLFPTWTPFFMPNPVSADRIWRDPEVVALHTTERMKEMMIDSTGSPFRLGTAKNLLIALELARSRAIHGFKVPYCIAHGTKDMGVPIEGSELMAATASTPAADAEFYRIQDAYHDLLGDHAAEEVTEHFVEFMKKQIQKHLSQ